jgi:hypothetical protein
MVDQNIGSYPGQVIIGKMQVFPYLICASHAKGRMVLTKGD